MIQLSDLPVVNASLNSLALVLLTTGFVMIKQRRVDAQIVSDVEIVDDQCALDAGGDAAHVQITERRRMREDSRRRRDREHAGEQPAVASHALSAPPGERSHRATSPGAASCREKSSASMA